MRTTVWVGRVKSTCAPNLLESAFGKVGQVAKVETGFAGFAFVEYENEDDADRACEELNKTVIPSVGEVLVSRATLRGYEDAVTKRDNYWRKKGTKEDSKFLAGPGMGRARGSRSASRRKTSRSRSRSRHRSRSFSRSRSRSRTKERRSRSQSRSKSGAKRERNGSRSWSNKPDRPIRRRKGVQDGERRSESEGSVHRPPVIRTKRCEEEGSNQELPRIALTAAVPSTELVPLTTLEDPIDSGVGLARRDRANVVCFFDGAHVCDVLLEGSSVMKVPDQYIPNMLNGFPHGFSDMSQEAAMMLLGNLSAFTQPNGKVGEEHSTEVRQTLAINTRGERVMRKSLVVDGEIVSSEEQVL